MRRDIAGPVGWCAFGGFLACIPLANWMIRHFGTVRTPDGTWLIPVAPGMLAPSGVVLAGVALVLRDVVQRCLGLHWGVLAVLLGTSFSVVLAPESLILASGIAFLLSELLDLAIYTPLQRRRLVLAVVASSAAGLMLDSLVFLTLAFGSFAYLPGQVLGKAWAVLLSLPLIRLLRQRVPTPA